MNKMKATLEKLMVQNAIELIENPEAINGGDSGYIESGGKIYWYICNDDACLPTGSVWKGMLC